MAGKGLLQSQVIMISSFGCAGQSSQMNLQYIKFTLNLSVYIRESEPNSWEDTMKDELDRAKYPRMPWHDVQCALYGPPCRDVARHFVQRWNYAKVSYIQWSAHHRKNLSHCIYKLTVPFYLTEEQSFK
jgi:phosphatidylserine/phosphatidylglycerophosphate/cardiolipin synthase-like enzyme